MPQEGWLKGLLAGGVCLEGWLRPSGGLPGGEPLQSHLWDQCVEITRTHSSSQPKGELSTSETQPLATEVAW